MKKHILFASLLSALFMPAAAALADDAQAQTETAPLAAQVGAPAPDFTATDSNGNTVQLSGFAGKTVVLEWTNHECPFVKKHYDAGNMQKLQNDVTEKSGIWLTVISSAEGKQGHVSGDQANALASARGAAATAILLDPSGDLGRLYEAKATPHMYVIDTNGVLAYAGAIDSIPSADVDDIAKAENYVTTALDSLAQGAPVATPLTRAYGCAVKY